MAKLTDTQLIVLSKAAQREDGAAEVPDRMNKAAAPKVGASLVARKLMREIRARPGMPVWRTDDEGRRISLVITRAGRDAIGARRRARRRSRSSMPGTAKRLTAQQRRRNAVAPQACPGQVRSRRCLSPCWRKTRARRSTP